MQFRNEVIHILKSQKVISETFCPKKIYEI